MAGARTAAWARTTAAAATSVRLDARLGFDGAIRNLTATPLTLLVESDALFAGTIELRIQGSSGASVIRREIEVPGGSRKELTVLLPRPDLTSVRAIDHGGRVLGESTPTQSDALRSESLIGVLSDAGPPLAHVAVPPAETSARVVSVPQSILGLGAPALRSLSHLVVDAAGAGRLSKAQRDALVAFAEAGGELVVVSPTEASLSFLPAAWRGSGGGAVRRTPAGLGGVTVAISSFGGAAWSDGGAMWPRVLHPADGGQWRGEELGSTDWLEILSVGGAFRRPPIGWLLTFVLLYVALAGPLNFIVLARLQRRDLGWVTVPVIAVVFAGIAYAAGHGVRNVPIKQGYGIMVADAGVQRTSLAFGVLSRSGGVERLRIPSDWLTEPLSISGGINESSPSIKLEGQGSVAAFDLPIGAVGTVVARNVRIVETKPAGTLVSDGTKFGGAVTNTTPFKLHNVSVVVGRSSVGLENMDAGGKANVEVVPTNVEQEPGFFDPGMLFNGRFTSEEQYGLSQKAARLTGLGQPGRAFLVGWTSLTDASESLGLGRVRGRLMVLQPLGISAKRGTKILDDGVWRTILQTDGTLNTDTPFLMVDSAKTAVVRFDVPAGTRSVEIALAAGDPRFQKVFPVPIPANGGAFAVPDVQVAPPDQASLNQRVSVYDFARGRWTKVALRDGKVSLTLTGTGAGFVRDGAIVVRVEGDFQQTIFPTNFRVRGEVA